jgi:hypothetical protein
MDRKRRQQILLGVLFGVLAIVVYRAYNPPPAGELSSSNDTVAASRRPSTAVASAPDVHLDALDSERPGPVSTHRDLFRFKAKAPAAVQRPGPSPLGPGGGAAPPTGPPGPPPLPAIPYKFTGLVEGRSAKKIAVLSDGRGMPVHGREGDIIDGRFRIVRIGVESVEMEYLDGRGRQTIRLTGSGS